MLQKSYITIIQWNIFCMILCNFYGFLSTFRNIEELEVTFETKVLLFQVSSGNTFEIRKKFRQSSISKKSFII